MDQDTPSDYSEPPVRGVAQAGVRIANERAVLTLITTNPGASNADLARLSGLGPQTTSRILTDLEARGLITRGQVLRGRRGQPATPLFLNRRGAFSIGVELGWRHLELVLIDLVGTVLTRYREDYDYPVAAHVFPVIAREVKKLVAILPPEHRSRLLGLGVASPTTIAASIEGLGGTAEQRHAWLCIDIAKQIQDDTGLSTTWFNDGNAACWAEIAAHVTPRPANFAYFQIGAFVGAGIVTNEGLWEGPTGRAANLGALLVTDRCGLPAFLHRIASLRSFERRLNQAGVAVPAGSPHLWDWMALEPHAGAWIEDAASALAQAILSTQAMIELDEVIVDGVLPRPVLTRLIEEIHRQTALLPKPSEESPPIGAGALGIDATALGAAELPLFRHYFSRGWNLFTA